MSVVGNTYTKAIRVTLFCTFVSLFSFLIGFALKALDVKGWAYFFLAAPVLLACLIALPVCLSVGRIEQRQLQLLLDGNFLAHWTYRKEDCLRFAELEWQRTKIKVLRLMLKVTGSMMLAGVGFAWLEGSLLFLDGLLFGSCIGVLLGILVGMIFCWFGWIARQACLTGPPEVYVGAKGVYLHGRFVSWSLPWLTLRSVKLEPGDPSALHFEIKGNQSGVQELRVAVPKEREGEVKRLLAHFPAGRTAPSKRGK